MRSRSGAAPCERVVQLKTKAGLVLLLIGVGIFFASRWWTKTRNLARSIYPLLLARTKPRLRSSLPISTPSISSRFGHEPQFFRRGHFMFSGYGDRVIAFAGIPDGPVATWILSSGGRELKRGSSAEPHATADPVHSDSRVIGEFQGKAGQPYTLQVSFTLAATALAVARPHLRVAAASIVYTDLQSAGVLVFSIAFICGLLGRFCSGSDITQVVNTDVTQITNASDSLHSPAPLLTSHSTLHVTFGHRSTLTLS